MLRKKRFQSKEENFSYEFSELNSLFLIFNLFPTTFIINKYKKIIAEVKLNWVNPSIVGVTIPAITMAKKRITLPIRGNKRR